MSEERAELAKVSYSAMRRFLNCRKSFMFRYIQRIEPIYVSDALSFGKLIHSCLEALYSDEPYMKVITGNYPDTTNKWQAHYSALSQAIMGGYVNLYEDVDDGMKVLSTELAYECDIINPITDEVSDKYRLHGFIDMVVERSDGIWLCEHKTAATLNANYIERIWHDLQIMLYAIAYERMTGIKVRGIIYNVIQKAQLKQKKGEQFKEFADRLKDRYLTDKTMFHREEILVDELRTKDVENELWQITQDMGVCEHYYKNRSQCYGFGECEFFKICNSNDNPLIIQNYYKERENDVTNGKEQEENKSF